MNPQTISAMAFDLDGVIIDSHPAHTQAWRQLFIALGRELSNSELDFVLEGRKRDAILRHFLGELSPDQILEYGARKDELYEDLAGSVSLMPGFLDLLAAGERIGILNAIATSAAAARTRRTLARLGLEGRFAAIVTGSDVAAGKPDPAVYQLVAERLERPVEAVLAFEDSTSGVTAAKAAGMSCVAICRCQSAPRLLGAGADLWVASFADLSLAQLQLRLGKRIAG
jgi:beta-phosphoglucomutase